MEIKSHAVRTLNTIVDFFWPEIADVAFKLYFASVNYLIYLMSREQLSKDASFSDSQLAALVLSKVYFHMEKWDESIRLALLAGSLFDIHGASEYNRTILNKAIDQYVELEAFNYGAEKAVSVDRALQSVFEQVVKTCLEQNDLHQVCLNVYYSFSSIGDWYFY